MRRLARLSNADWLALGSALILLITFLYFPWTSSLTGLTAWATIQAAAATAEPILYFAIDLIFLSALSYLFYAMVRPTRDSRQRLVAALIGLAGLAYYAFVIRERPLPTLLVMALIAAGAALALNWSQLTESRRRALLALLLYAGFAVLGVYGLSYEAQTVPSMLFVAVAGVSGLLLALWGISSSRFQWLASDMQFVLGLVVLSNYAIYVIHLLRAGQLGDLGAGAIGFWVILLAAIGYIAQAFVPRPEGEIARGAASPLIPLIGLLIANVVLLRAFYIIGLGEYNLETFVRQLQFGIAQGSVYALVALGYTLVYGILFMINFAHGEVFISGAYMGFFAITAMRESGFLESNTLLALLITFAAAVVTSVVVAVGLERIAYRPLRNAPRLVPLITAIGASIFLQESFKGLFGASPKVYPGVNFYVLPQAFPNLECTTINGADVCRGLDLISGRYPIELDFSGIPVLANFLGTNSIEIIFRPIYLLVLVVAIAMMVGLWFFVQRTKQGKAMRAVAEDKPTASLMGVNVDGVIVTTFMLGAALAGVAAVLFALYNTQITPRTGFLPGLKAFTAAVLGGIGNIPGAAIGGFVLGTTESVAPSMLDIHNQLKDVLAFGILVLVLIFRPSGILGEVLTEKKA